MNTLVYSIDKTENPTTLYINLTNSCTNNCVFCLREQKDDVCGKDMWLDNENYTIDDLISQFENFETPKQVVFCGYGEPMLRLEILKAFAKYLKEKYPNIFIRINTNGHANAIHKRNVVPELKGLIDEFSVSLNASCEEDYDKISQPKIKNAYEKVKEFISNCAEEGISVVASIVDGYQGKHIDVENCRIVAENLGAKFRVREWIPNGY